jgi:tetratricopeptide (TPR) repeat protein
MQGELTGLDLLFLAALFDQPLGQLRAFAISDHPTGDVTAENIEERAIELNPEWKRYYVDVAIVADSADSYKNSEEGLKLWQLAIESAADDPRAYAGYANALSRRGKTAEAEAIFQKALAANPSDAESAAGLCSLYIKQKNPMKLRPSCTTTIQLDSGQLESLAWELRDLKEYALAESAYRKALERGFDPQHTLELNLANVLFEEGKASEAAQMYKQYVARNPHDSTYLDAYAMALESSGDIQGAEKEYLKAVEHSDLRNPQCPRAFLPAPEEISADIRRAGPGLSGAMGLPDTCVCTDA